MFIYVFDPIGILNGPFEVPAIPGIGQQLPGNAIQMETLLAKPDPGHVWALIEGKPQQTVDNRGVVFSTETGAEGFHLELGPLPDGLTKEPRPSAQHHWSDGVWVKNAAQIHQLKISGVNGACEAAITAGFTSDALGSPHHYSSQLDDQLNLTGAILRGLEMPYACRDEQGVKAFRLHTAAQLRQVGDDFTLYKLQLLQHANELKEQLDLALAAGDAEAMELIRWEAVQP